MRCQTWAEESVLRVSAHAFSDLNCNRLHHRWIVTLSLPVFTLFNPFSAIPLFFIISKLVQQVAGEILTVSAMIFCLCLAARFHRTAVAPERLLNMYASLTVHLFAIGTFAAQNSTS